VAGSLPTVRGGVQCLYPVTRRVEFLTDVAIALDSTEQRFKRRPALTTFELPYRRITLADTNTMRAFFASQKGTFDSTWDFTLGSTTYSAMTFLDPDFAAREEADAPTYYSFTLRARQTQNTGQTAGSPGAAFPALSSGLRAQLPYTTIRRASVMVNDNPMGPRYAWTWFGGSLSGFPTGLLHGWELTFPVLTDADLSTIETHFRNQWGRWSGFSFTDPDDSTTYTKCRYDQDVLAVSHDAFNQSSLTLRIIETN
jgi:hypothetical protein